ncbi:MAG TPA: hypothetical protein VLF39_02285 [Candidatus Saccharimonadales bacterium]|nr:hypothetical protein [Candidatus Saccharimonadales bacterium]
MADKSLQAKIDAVKKANKTDKAEPKQPDKKTMYIKVYGPFRTYFDGQGTSVSAVNDTGPFDILPRHHNFMTLLNPCELVVRTEKTEEKFMINKGVMHVKADKVIVFLDV